MTYRDTEYIKMCCNCCFVVLLNRDDRMDSEYFGLCEVEIFAIEGKIISIILYLISSLIIVNSYNQYFSCVLSKYEYLNFFTLSI